MAMQRLKAFPVAVINLLIRFFQYLLNKLKHLALHILKHPLGTIWWCIKMYFALMLLTLFVACSFGAAAEPPAGFHCAVGTPMQGVGCTVDAPKGGNYHVQWATKYTGSGKTAPEAWAKLLQSWASSTEQCMGNGNSSKKVITQRLDGPYAGQSYVGSFTGETSCSYTEYNPATQKDESRFTKSNSSYTGISVESRNGFYCPPEGPAFAGFLRLVPTSANTSVCAKDYDKVNNCFTQPDFQIGNQYHFDPKSEGQGKVCVMSDSGEKCPWKEMPGSNGMFQPDIENKDSCELDPPPLDSTPAPKPQDPEKCTAGGNGMKVCKADPNEKCSVNSSGAMSCPDSCGFMNGEFMCFTEPDIPDDPNMPDKKPVPKPDDNITDPLKKMPDMNKQDLKEIQRGVESRLEGFNASMENALGELAAQGKNAEKASGVSNKLLNSINQNTADTVKELKKLTGDESNPQPNYEETELGEKNDWQVRNFGTVMKAAADKILEKPMFQAIDGYFDVSFGGTCPTWSASVWVFEVEINQFCDQSFQAILPLIRNLVILIFSFLAFRVAFL